MFLRKKHLYGYLLTILQRSVKYILWLYNWSLQESIPAVMQNKDGPQMANSLLLTVESSISEWETGGLILDTADSS